MAFLRHMLIKDDRGAGEQMEKERATPHFRDTGCPFFEGPGFSVSFSIFILRSSIPVFQYCAVASILRELIFFVFSFFLFFENCWP